MIKESPIAIAITWGKDMIAEKGGLLSFIRHFEKCLLDEEGYWLQKSKNRPKHDILYVYIVVCNQVKYKLFYGGYETGERDIYVGNGHSWSSRQRISWPRIVLAGPFEKAPYKISMRGFQGFRYVKELF